MEANGGELVYQINVDSKEADKNLKETSKNINALAESAENSERRGTTAIGGIKKAMVAAAIGAAVIKLGKEIIKATEEAERARAIIAKGTGAVGDNLKALEQTANEVFKQTARAREDIANGLAEINTRFGLTGEELEKTTLTLSKFADIAGGSVKQNVAQISKTMQRWKIDLKDMPQLLDKLTASAQASGINIETLNSALTESAGTLQAMGYSLDESIAMLAQFEKAGLSGQSVLFAMKKSFQDSASAGKNAKEEWKKLIEAISSAKTETEANELAVKNFGSRVGTEMVTAIRSGSLAFEEFEQVVKNSAGALDSTKQASETTAEKIQKLRNQVSVFLSDIGGELAPTVTDFLKTMEPLLRAVFKVLKPILEFTIVRLKVIAPLITGILEGIGKVITGEGLLQETTNNLITQNQKLIKTSDDLFFNSGKNIAQISRELNNLFDSVQGKGSVFTNVKLIEQAEEYERKLKGIATIYKLDFIQGFKSFVEQNKFAYLTAQEFVDAYGKFVEETRKKTIESRIAEFNQAQAIEKEKERLLNQETKSTFEQQKDLDEIYDKMVLDSKQKYDSFIASNKEWTEYEKQAIKEITAEYELSTGEMVSTFSNLFDTMDNKQRTSLIRQKAMWKEFWAELNKIWDDLKKQFADLMANQTIKALDNVGRALTGARNDWEQYGIDAVKALAEVLNSLAKELAVLAIKAAVMGNWVGAGLAAAGAVAAGIGGGVLGGIAQKLQNSKDNKSLDDTNTSNDNKSVETILTATNEIDKKSYDEGYIDGETIGLKKGESIGYQRGFNDGYAEAGLGSVYNSLSNSISVAPASVMNSVNFNNNQNIVLEVDGQQLAYTNLRYMDDVSQFVVQGA